MAAGAIVLLGIVVALVVGFSSGSGQTVSAGRVGKVRRGPMVINTIEEGAVEAERKKEIQNDLRWSVTITEVVPDGTRVNKGDTIIVFECKELTDAISRQKLDLASAENLYIEASEKLKITDKELKNKVYKARQKLTDAKEDLKRWAEAEWPIKLGEAKKKVMLKERDLLLTQADLEFMHVANNDPDLRDNPPYSQKQIDAKQLDVDKTQVDLEKIKSELDMLKEYDGPRDSRKKGAAVRDAELELERAEVEARTKMMVDEATATSRKSRLEMHQNKLKELEEDFAKLEVTADRSGLVIYKTSRHPWDRSEVTVGVGEKIRPRQLLMIIPDMTSLRVRTKVAEAIVNQIKPGQEVIIHLDAKPDLVITGKVERVPPMPDPARWWDRRSTRFYTIRVKVDEEHKDELLPEMTAEVELILGRLDNVLQVPIAAVFAEQEKRYCWRLSGGKRQKVTVKIGRMNDSAVEIVSGLQEGDKVLLVQPEDLIGPEFEEAKSAPPGRQQAKKGR